jgi:hypothetical protein
MTRTPDNESLTDAVDRLLDRIFMDYPQATMTAAMREAVELARRAYRRERHARNEYHTDFPVVEQVTP